MSKFDFDLTIKMSLGALFDQPQSFWRASTLPAFLLYAALIAQIGSSLIFGGNLSDNLSLDRSGWDDPTLSTNQIVNLAVLILFSNLFSYSWQRFLMDGGDGGAQLLNTSDVMWSMLWQSGSWRSGGLRFLIKQAQLLGLVGIPQSALFYYFFQTITDGYVELFWPVVSYIAAQCVILFYMLRLQLVFPAILAGSHDATFGEVLKLSKGSGLALIAAYLVLSLAVLGVLLVATIPVVIVASIGLAILNSISDSFVINFVSYILAGIFLVLYPFLLCAVSSVHSAMSAFVVMQMHPDYRPVWQKLVADREQIEVKQDQDNVAPKGPEPQLPKRSPAVLKSEIGLSPELASQLLPGPPKERTGPRPKYGQRKRY